MRIMPGRWLLLCINVVFLTMNLAGLFVLYHAKTANSGSPYAGTVEQTIGMDLYLAKPPFTLFVDHAFPENDSFLFHRDERELVLLVNDTLSIDDTKNENAEELRTNALRNVLLGLGDTLDVSIDYSNCGLDDYDIRDLRLKRMSGDNRQIFIDYLADGSYDLYMQMNTKTFIGQNKVYFQGEWQDVIEGITKTPDCYRTVLANKDEVRFDLKTGQWALVNH